jgi:hypothetical protein
MFDTEKMVKNKPPRAAETPMAGVVASVARKSVIGPDGPVNTQSPRQRLCGLLKLKGATDSQVFADALAMIEDLQGQLAKAK